MTDIPFDTMSAVTRMVDAGVEQKHAEAITASMREAVTGGVATKADVVALRADFDVLRADFDVLRAEMKSMRTDIIWIKVIGGFIAIAVAEPLLTRFFT